MAGDLIQLPGPDTVPTRLLNRLSDTIMLRVYQSRSNAPIKTEGRWVWAAPWGRVDLIEKSVVRKTDDGALIVVIDMIGHLALAVVVVENDTVKFRPIDTHVLVLDKSRAPVTVPDHITSYIEYCARLQPAAVAGFHRRGDDTWTAASWNNKDLPTL